MTERYYDSFCFPRTLLDNEIEIETAENLKSNYKLQCTVCKAYVVVSKTKSLKTNTLNILPSVLSPGNGEGKEKTERLRDSRTPQNRNSKRSEKQGDGDSRFEFEFQVSCQ